MLSGQVPFQRSGSWLNHSADFIMQRITGGDVRFEGPQWESISPQAKQIIKGNRTYRFEELDKERNKYSRFSDKNEL